MHTHMHIKCSAASAVCLPFGPTFFHACTLDVPTTSSLIDGFAALHARPQVWIHPYANVRMRLDLLWMAVALMVAIAMPVQVSECSPPGHTHARTQACSVHTRAPTIGQYTAMVGRVKCVAVSEHLGGPQSPFVIRPALQVAFAGAGSEMIFLCIQLAGSALWMAHIVCNMLTGTA